MAEIPVITDPIVAPGPDDSRAVEAPEQDREAPKLIDTYAAAYAFILLFLIPGVALMSRLPFGDDRATTYTFAYVSYVTVPFLLGLIVTFMIDGQEDEGLKKRLIRTAVLTPLVVVSGVTVMFTASLAMVPISALLGIAGQGLAVVFWPGLVAVAAPLAVSLVRRLRAPKKAADIVQIVAIAVAFVLVAGGIVLSFIPDVNIYELARKDVIIYLAGALTWYLPAFGVSAGIWRGMGLV